MKVLVLGSSGIIGQHMRLRVPPSASPIWHRLTQDTLFESCEMADLGALRYFLRANPANLIINLAGLSDTDEVERNRDLGLALNVAAVSEIADFCKSSGIGLIQVSTQGVFGGDVPPYAPEWKPNPVNEYGRQKAAAEAIALAARGMVARLTFVLGIRPMPNWGRQNPAEQMLSGQRKQVNDRFFSPLLAQDAAYGLWQTAVYGYRPGGIVHFGIPCRKSRYDVGRDLGCEVEAVSHDSFRGIARRPHDTTYRDGATGFFTGYRDTINAVSSDWESRQSGDLLDRAREIAIFLGKSEEECHAKLKRGFGPLHQDVTACFKRTNPRDDAALLDWYRRTEAYIWELSAYHCDRGFNYSGMCRGVADRLRVAGAKRVLVLGDGIGSFTIALRRAGMDTTYHDLNGSRTADFARFRLARHTGTAAPLMLTGGWEPNINGGPYDAIVCADFLEHVPNVEAWVRAIRGALHSGGLLFSQNGFAMGSGSNGSMPMHLARNDRYEKEWDPMLSRLAFTQDSSNWYRAAA